MTNSQICDNPKVLISGGAGYIGSILVRQLLRQGYGVRVLDSLVQGGEAILDLLEDAAFDFVKGDVRDEETARQTVRGVAIVVHLAAIVGDPACTKQPELAWQTNVGATQTLYDAAEAAGVRRFIFASTCSNYGKMSDANCYVDEGSDLVPVSLYAETKVASERYLLSRPRRNVCKPICLRFATVYGLSPRPRFDLTVNEFTKELALGRELVVFGEQFWRPYCHVVDLARSVLAVLGAPVAKVAFNVFNVGDTRENYTKQMLVDEIRNQIQNCRVKYVPKDEDPRNYRVSFEKIRRELGFHITYTVPLGIAQVKRAVQEGFFQNCDDPRYRNA